jgi:hypothetical protein
MFRKTLARFILPHVLYQLATSCCRAIAFPGRPTNEILTWKHSDGPLNGLQSSVIEDIQAGPSCNLLDHEQNEVGRPHGEVGGVDTVNFPILQRYQTNNDDKTGKVFLKHTCRGRIKLGRAGKKTSWL